MTELETKLAKALNNLVFSADAYIEDGSWIDILDEDIQNARSAINEYRDAKKYITKHKANYV
jgi:hypothetical protein